MGFADSAPQPHIRSFRNPRFRLISGPKDYPGVVKTDFPLFPLGNQEEIWSFWEFSQIPPFLIVRSPCILYFIFRRCAESTFYFPVFYTFQGPIPSDPTFYFQRFRGVAHLFSGMNRLWSTTDSKCFLGSTLKPLWTRVDSEAILISGLLRNKRNTLCTSRGAARGT